MKTKLAALFSWALTLSSVLFPSQSYATTVINKLKHKTEPIKTEQKEIRWTKSLSKSYAKALISAQYETWGISEYKALLKLCRIGAGYTPSPEQSARAQAWLVPYLTIVEYQMHWTWDCLLCGPTQILCPIV